jgi:hypothetical protein
VKALGDTDVVIGDDGFRNVRIEFDAPRRSMLRFWACAVSRDTIPSNLAGPYRIEVPGGSGG